MTAWVLLLALMGQTEPSVETETPSEKPAAPVEAAPVVKPPPPQLTPQQKLAQADTHLANLDDEKARDLMKTLIDDPTVNPRLRAQAALRLGMAETNLLKPEKAHVAFKLALGADPYAQLPPSASPKARELYDAARVELAAPPEKPKALPPKPKKQQEPALGWVRPTSWLLLASGAGLLLLGTVVAIAGVAVREWTIRLTDPVQQSQYARLLLPIALAAGGSIFLAIPVTGTGLALFFLSSEDGPLRDKNPVDPDSP